MADLCREGTQPTRPPALPPSRRVSPFFARDADSDYKLPRTPANVRDQTWVANERETKI